MSTQILSFIILLLKEWHENMDVMGKGVVINAVIYKKSFS